MDTSYYYNYNTFLVAFFIILLISLAIGIYRNAMIRQALERQALNQPVRVVYFRGEPHSGPVGPQPFPMGPIGMMPQTAPPPLPPYPEDNSFNRPHTNQGKPPPYAAVA